jgi:2-C-methyl-D-erythritol 4-phosphate cytidylyltransferase
VLAGVESIGAGCEYVLVHDAARPLVRGADVEKVIAAARAHGAAVLGHACVDSVKAERAGRIAASLPREHTWLVQTPQAARRQSLLGALVRAERDAFVGSDEASILERAGIEVALVEGARDNLKVTFPEDLIVAEFLLKRRVT